VTEEQRRRLGWIASQNPTEILTGGTKPPALNSDRVVASREPPSRRANLIDLLD
jgi:hypothetical protein